MLRRLHESLTHFLHLINSDLVHVAKSLSHPLLLETNAIWRDDYDFSSKRRFRETSGGKVGDLNTAWLSSWLLVERARESVLWVWAVARIGGQDGVWGKAERAEVKRMLGWEEAVVVQDETASNWTSTLADASETRALGSKLASVKQVERETLEVSKVDAAFEALDEKGPLATKYYWCESQRDFCSRLFLELTFSPLQRVETDLFLDLEVEGRLRARSTSGRASEPGSRTRRRRSRPATCSRGSLSKEMECVVTAVSFISSSLSSSGSNSLTRRFLFVFSRFSLHCSHLRLRRRRSLRYSSSHRRKLHPPTIPHPYLFSLESQPPRPPTSHASHSNLEGHRLLPRLRRRSYQPFRSLLSHQPPNLFAPADSSLPMGLSHYQRSLHHVRSFTLSRSHRVLLSLVDANRAFLSSLSLSIRVVDPKGFGELVEKVETDINLVSVATNVSPLLLCAKDSRFR